MGAGRGLRGYGGTGGEHTALLSHDDGLEDGCVKGPHRWMRVAVNVVLVSIITSATVVVTLVSLDEPSGDARKGGDGYRNGAVASDAGVCSDIGVDVLRSGGGAVDAAIATTLCIGAVNSHSSGIGGGGFMLVHNGTAVETIDFREMAPAASTQMMFANYSDCDAGAGQGDTTHCPSRLGGLAVAVPGELRGLEEAHRRHGRLPWRSVLAPVIALCRNGFAVTGTNANAIRSSLHLITQDPVLNATFVPDGRPLEVGDWLQRPRLAKTLELVAEMGADALYAGAMAQRIVDRVQNNEFGTRGILTLDDLLNYRPVVRDPTSVTYQGRTIFSAPPPASGAVLSLMLNVLENYDLNCTEGRTVLEDHRIIEAMKFGYGYRTRIADPCCGDASAVPHTCSNTTHCDMVTDETREMLSKGFAESLWRKISDTSTNHTPEFYGGDYDVQDTPGTTHVSVVGPDGDAVAITSTINTNFGSKLMTEDGIILNNEMDDFSTPGFSNAFGFDPSPANFVRPYKRPLSSSAPTIVLDADGVFQFVAGASGGARITTAVAQVVLNVLSFCDSVRVAVDRPRIHHQLLPVWIYGEQDYPEDRIEALERIGHYWNFTSTNGVCQAIARGTVGPSDADPTMLYAASDGTRKAGARASGF